MVSSEVLATVLPLEILNAEVNDTVVEVLPTQVRVTCSCLDLKDPILDGKQGHIKGAPTHVIDQHIALAGSFLVKPICNRSSGGLVDDPQDIQASY